MIKVIVAVYDDAAKSVPFRVFNKKPHIIYRTANMEFIEELSNLGFEPLAVLLEEDIDNIKAGSFTNDSLAPEDIAFLTDHQEDWVLPG